jgi:hypothetical protein
MKAGYHGPQYWTVEQRLQVTAASEPSRLATSTHPSAPYAVHAPA